MRTPRPARALGAALTAAALLVPVVPAAAVTGAVDTTAVTDRLPTRSTDALVAKALDVPVVAADGLARAIVAFEGGMPAGTLDAMTGLGVTRGLELEAIDAVAVTATSQVLADVATLEGVTAVEPQRRLAVDLHVSRQQVDVDGVGDAETYTRDVNGEAVMVDHQGLTGEGVTVAVLDSGIWAPHGDFGGPTGDRVVRGLYYSFTEVQDEGGISYEDWDLYAETFGPLALQDEIGHGTHVASTVGGDGAVSEANGGVDLQGVAPGVDFVSMKVATAPFGVVEDFDWEEAALAAFDYSIRHKDELGIKITQNSWGLLPAEPDCFGLHCGEPTDFDGMAEMVAAVTDAGISTVFSSGNSGPGFDTTGIYNDAGNAVNVGAACKASTVDGTRCQPGQTVVGFSSRGKEDGTGPQVDVIAPGDHIMAALSPASILTPLTECATTQEVGYFCISGTSMASPHVAGIVALMYEANMALTPAEVEQCLKDTADDVLEAGFDVASGFGMANGRSAIACAVSLLPVDDNDECREEDPVVVGDECDDDDDEDDSDVDSDDDSDSDDGSDEDSDDDSDDSDDDRGRRGNQRDKY